MRKQRVYKGCELESPIYREIVREMQLNKVGKTIVNEHKTKRGKRSSLQHTSII